MMQTNKPFMDTARVMLDDEDDEDSLLLVETQVENKLKKPATFDFGTQSLSGDEENEDEENGGMFK
jgi:hypothetical protein